MTTEFFKRFMPYERNFVTATHSNFIRFTRSDIDKFDAVLKDYRGKGLTSTERNCQHCMLTVVKAVASDYFKFKDSPRGKSVLKQMENGEQEGTPEEERSDAGQE